MRKLIIGHSHGGNIAIEAVNLLTDRRPPIPVETFITIGTPVRTDYQLSSDENVGQHLSMNNTYD